MQELEEKAEVSTGQTEKEKNVFFSSSSFGRAVETRLKGRIRKALHATGWIPKGQMSGTVDHVLVSIEDVVEDAIDQQRQSTFEWLSEAVENMRTNT